MKKRMCLVLLISSVTAFQEVYKWKEIDFNWPDRETKIEALEKGEYIPENNIPIAVEKWKNKLFITLPRYETGVASTLNYISLQDPSPSPLLTPYPNWKFNFLHKNNTNQTQLISTFRVKVDVCDRLWVIDMARNGLNDGFLRPPSLLVFNLNTNTLIRRYELRRDEYCDMSYMENLVIDVYSDNCDEAFAYISDLGCYSIIVYSWKLNDSWKIEHDYFHMDPLQGLIKVDGQIFSYIDGVIGLALSRPQNNGSRKLIFNPLASTTTFEVSTSVLKNKNLATNKCSYKLYKVLGERGDNTQATSTDLDLETNVLFQTQVNKMGVACWNINKPLKPENVHLIYKNDTWFYPNDIRIDRERYLWVTINKLPVMIGSGLNSDSYNFRIFKMHVDEALKNACLE